MSRASEYVATMARVTKARGLFLESLKATLPVTPEYRDRLGNAIAIVDEDGGLSLGQRELKPEDVPAFISWLMATFGETA